VLLHEYGAILQTILEAIPVSNNNGYKVLKMRAIFKILKLIKPRKNNYERRKSNLKKTISITILIDDVTSSIEAGFQICIKRLASAHVTSVGTILSILHKDSGPVMKSAKG
jgi:hypothetical protein